MLTISAAGPARFDAWSKLLTRGCMLACSAETDLLLQGHAPKAVFLVERGFIKLTHVADDGREIVVGVRYPGTILGFSAAILGLPHATTATAITKCEVRSIPTDFCLDLLRADCDFAWHALQVQSRDAGAHLSHLIELKIYSARDRLERFLCEWIHTYEQTTGTRDGPIRIELKHFEIAGLIAVTPQHLSRLTKVMKKEGLVHNDRNHMTIPDRRLLLDRDSRRLRQEHSGVELPAEPFQGIRAAGARPVSPRLGQF